MHQKGSRLIRTPVVERPRANLDDIKTPPTPSPGSDDDHDPDGDYEHGIATQSYTYKAVVHASTVQVVRTYVPSSIPQHPVQAESQSPQQMAATTLGGAATANNFYAIRIGRKRSIYSTWDVSKSHTDGFKGAKFKKFSTLDAAAAFVGDNTAESKDRN